MPTVAESMITICAFSVMTWTPLLVGYLSRPVETGTVRTTWPSEVTVIWWVLVSTVDTWAEPILKWTAWLLTPHTPLPASNPDRPADTVTLVLAGQKSRGRKWTSLSENQCQ